MDKALPACLAAAALAALAGCDAGSDRVANLNPFASFETRCSRLPAASITVHVPVVSFREDESQSYEALSQLSEITGTSHRTVGLTQARLSYASTLETRGLEDRRNGRVCARPGIEVTLAVAPMTVFIAREYAHDACRRAATYAHEMKHVEVYRAFVQEGAERLRRELPSVLGGHVHFAPDAARSQQALQAALDTYLSAFLKESSETIRARHADVDSPEEYARIDGACA